MAGKKVNRRKFISSSAAGALAAAAISERGSSATAEAKALPNILWIIADDVGDGDLGCYGHPTIRTENLDRLAAEGIRFTNAFVTTSSCSPSRASLFTGRYPHATGAEDLHTHLPADQVILPGFLAEQGYHTMNVGKLHLGPEGARQFHQVDPAHVDEDSRPWKRLLDGRPRDKAFFFSIGITDPHRPGVQPYQRGVIPDPTDPADIIVPPYLADTPETREDLAGYYDSCVRLDRNVGEILSYLEAEGLAENTLVVFFSDNGMPFPRAKTSCYDSGIRVPMIARLPGRIPAGAVSEALISTVDLAPTMLALPGVSPPASMQGLNMQEALFDPRARIRKYIHAERNWHDMDDHVRAVRDERYKYIKNFFPREPLPLSIDLFFSPSYKALLRLRETGRLSPGQMRLFMVPRPAEELYDTRADPYEFVNLAGETVYKNVLERMRAECERWTTDDVPPEKRMENNVDFYTHETFGTLGVPPTPRRKKE